MFKRINSDKIPPQSLKLNFLTHKYTLNVKQKRFDNIFDKITLKPNRREMKSLKRKYKVSPKEVVINTMKTKVQRKTVTFKHLENKINAVTGGRILIKLENYVDFDIPVQNFTYVNDCIISNDIKISSKRPKGCKCGRDGQKSCYKSRNTCCANDNNSLFAYNHEGKLILPQGFPIYECGLKCKCGPNCGNRIVQKGSRDQKLCIFKTKDERGWGVKTLKDIPKGTFVEAVVGEIVTKSEAVRRENIQMDKLQQSFIFDLDFEGPIRQRFCIDCFSYGNVTRYLNHSCDPNLAVFNVWSDHRDHSIPTLALFSLKDIKKGEELTLDYKPQIGTQKHNVYQAIGIGSSQKPCLCGAANCRKYLWTR